MKSLPVAARSWPSNFVSLDFTSFSMKPVIISTAHLRFFLTVLFHHLNETGGEMKQ